jgi:hypothetical protein
MKALRLGYSHALLTVLFLSGMVVVPSLAAAPPQEVQLMEDPGAMTFKLNASESKFLPPAMYGTWSIEATVISSTAPNGLYMPRTHEIWALDRDDAVITLKNMSNNASATIEVDQVSGNTATFHHEASGQSGYYMMQQKIKIRETPTLTVDGDRMSGTNNQLVKLYNHRGQLTATYTAVIQVEGTRLAGAKVTFGNVYEPKPEFEVAPLQFRD